MHHMTSAVYRRESKSFCFTRLTSYLSIDLPLSQILSNKLLLSSPFQIQRPFLVTNIIASVIIGAYVYQNSYVSLKECGNVVICRVVMVKSNGKRSVDVVARHCKIADAWVDAECVADRWAIQVGRDVSG